MNERWLWMGANGRAVGLLVMAAALLAARSSHGASAEAAMISREPIFERASFLSCHASTLAETPGGLIAAWFGGTGEGQPDVDIWVSHREQGGWSAPEDIANGKQPDGKRLPCWNPVLFQYPGGPLVLFYKVGPSPRDWWGMQLTSTDAGRHWSAPTRLPDGILGPIKDKPVLISDGRLLCPSSTEDQGWRAHFEWTVDRLRSWQQSGPINDGKELSLIQPTLLRHPGGKLQALCRSRQGRIEETWSSDGGRTWSGPAPTELPNPNSGIDAVTLADGRHVLVYNHTEHGRSPLNVAVSRDGKNWRPFLALEERPGEFSYPAVIQTADGKIHITYTWQRLRIQHVVLDPEKIPDGR